jgi:hypothetical protein
MSLNTRGFDVTNIPRAQGLDFNIQPGQFTAGMNSGIGAYNAFNNIAEEVRDRPLKQKEREARLAQIEAEAQMAPVRRKLTEIELAKAGLPQSIITGNSIVRVPRAGVTDQYDVFEQHEGFDLDPVTGSRTPFQRAGKVLASAEEIANKQAIRNAELDRIDAQDIRAKAYKSAMEAKAINDAAKIENLKELKKAADAVAETKDWGHGKLLQDEHGEAVILYTNVKTGQTRALKHEGGVLKPVMREDPMAAFFNDPPGSRDREPKATENKPPVTGSNLANGAPNLSIGVFDNVDDNGNPVIAPQESATIPPLPITPLSTSKGYKIIPR